MLYTEAQNHWTELETRAMRGEEVLSQMDPGYREEYEAWLLEEAKQLPKLSAEERTEHFTAYLQKSLLKKKQEIVEALPVTEESKKELLALAQKDQLLLVSTDEGAHFDQVLTQEEAEKKNPLGLRLLSSSLTSVTNQLGAVVEEQTLLHVVSNLKGVGYNVDHAEIKNHKVVVQVTKPKATEEAESIEYEVVVNQPALVPLEYEYVSASGPKHIPETILAEEFGQPAPDASLYVPTEEELMEVQVNANFEEADKNRNKELANLALASFATTVGMNQSNEQVKNIEALEREEAWEQEQIAQRKPQLRFNVMEAKKKHSERKEEEAKEERDKGFRAKARAKKFEEAKKIAIEAQKKMEEQKKLALQKTTNGIKTAGATALIGGASFIGSITGLGMWVSQ